MGFFYIQRQLIRGNKLKNYGLIFVIFLIFANTLMADEVARKDNAVLSGKQTESFILEAQFAGPHQDTIIQRWVDKARNNTCYLYIPVVVPTLVSSQDKNTQAGLSQATKQPKVYGANNLGSISCIKSQ